MNNVFIRPGALQRIKLSINTTRFRATLYHAVLFLSLEILFGLIVYYSLYNNLLENLDVSLAKQAGAITRIVTSSSVDFDEFVPDSLFATPEDFVWDMIFDEVALTRRNSFIQISFNNKIIFKTVNLYNHQFSFPEKTRDFQIFDYSDTTLSSSIIRVVVTNNKKYQTITAFPKESVSQTLASLTDIFILLAPVFLLVSIAGGYILSRRSLSRIDAIIKRTEDITAQNLAEKIEGEEYNDEYGRLVRKMNEMIERIKTSIDYMNQFSISAAHELRTPLTILRGEIELALRSPKTPEQYVATLQSNYEETLRLIRIVANLFFISKADHKLLRLQKEKTEVDTFVAGVVRSLAILGKEKEITISAETSSGAEILIDRELITQALSNIVDNAVKYGDAGEKVLVKSFTREGAVIISVSNKGEGIPGDAAGKIFDRFFRVEQSRNRSAGGAGLGLSVVKAILDWHGASITVNSVPNELTTFTITFPPEKKD